MGEKKKKNKSKAYIITHKFVPRPGWQNDYEESIEIFLRMLANSEKVNKFQNAN